MDQQLIEYINQELKRGISPQNVKNALREVGWKEPLIEEAFASIAQAATSETPQAEAKAAAIPQQNPVQSPARASEKILDVHGDEKEPTVKKRISVKLILIIIGIIILVAAGLIAGDMWLNSRSRAVPIVENDNSQITSGEPQDISVTVGNSDSSMAATSSIPVAAIDQGFASGQNEKTEAERRDEQRIQDIDQLAAAQKTWFSQNGKYYTCGLAGGDCKGKVYGFPAQIGDYATAQDPLIDQYVSKKGACGKDYVYCGLNNAPYSQFFCYYAKLEGGGYYTASQDGSVKRSTPPKIFEECGVAN